MAPYSNDPQPSPYASIPNPIPNFDFPKPFWINKLRSMSLLGCTNPDLAFIEMAAAAAGHMYWSVVTPSTKQLIEGSTGRSWLCNSKQVISSVEQGEQIASSGTGRFIYGMLAGLDIAAYHAFFVSTGAVGVIDFASYAARFNRVCSGDVSPNRGLDAIGGWPVPSDDYGPGPSFQNAQGQVFGSEITIPKGYMGIHVAWCSYSLLDVPGGVVVSQRLRDHGTGEVLDECTVNNLEDSSRYAITSYFTSEGESTRDRLIELQIKCTEALGLRMVPAGGGCFVRTWKFGDPPGMSYLNMKQNLNKRGNKG
jgi:hypothetical protein